MKAGLSLTQMAQELERQQATKKDYIADTRKVTFSNDMKQTTLMGSSGAIGQFGVTNYASGQLAELLELPAKYFQRMREGHPDLLAHTVNNLLQREPSRRMVRTLDGNIRAFVSDKYRPLDNFDLAFAVMPVLREFEELRIESTQFTDTRFYIKAVYPKLETSIANVGDVVQAGITISNSEVGAGSLSVAPMIYRLSCKNGAVMADYGQKRYHVGKRAGGDSDAAFELFSDRTKELDDAALWSKVQDVTRGAMQAEVFEKITNKMKEAAGQKIEGKVEEVVELVARRNGYNEATQAGVLRHMIEGGDLSRWGLANAITRQSQDEDAYDVASQMERDGGSIVELPSRDWQALLAKPIARAA